jgi:hypothetical protein
LHYLLDR